MSKFLHRDDAPFAAAIWNKIDETVVQAAKSQLGARRLLAVEGPFGLGLKALPGPDRPVSEANGVRLQAPGLTPVAQLQASFRLTARDLAAFEADGVTLDLGPAAHAALALARQEDELLFTGCKPLGLEGLATAKGTLSHKLRSWDTVGTAAEDIIRAITGLDAAGFHGPFTLGLCPALFNQLFRQTPANGGTELQHLAQAVAAGIVKIPALATGGVLLNAGAWVAAIVLGQDIQAGFVGPDAGEYHFTISESLALRLTVPKAICILK
ncbi:MAG: family 1 encapsulin nanocompartment shell protein [Lentisphaeria bacterium]|jgi:uncharacterized linocin/CFP29 family protein